MVQLAEDTQAVEPIFVRPTQGAKAIGLGRTRFYELLASGEIPSIVLGRVRLVPVAGLREWARRQMEAAGADAR